MPMPATHNATTAAPCSPERATGAPDPARTPQRRRRAVVAGARRSGAAVPQPSRHGTATEDREQHTHERLDAELLLRRRRERDVERAEGDRHEGVGGQDRQHPAAPQRAAAGTAATARPSGRQDLATWVNAYATPPSSVVPAVVSSGAVANGVSSSAPTITGPMMKMSSCRRPPAGDRVGARRRAHAQHGRQRTHRDREPPHHGREERPWCARGRRREK
jgi:hypothetical protein